MMLQMTLFLDTNLLKWKITPSCVIKFWVYLVNQTTITNHFTSLMLSENVLIFSRETMKHLHHRMRSFFCFLVSLETHFTWMKTDSAYLLPLLRIFLSYLCLTFWKQKSKVREWSWRQKWKNTLIILLSYIMTKTMQSIFF